MKFTKTHKFKPGFSKVCTITTMPVEGRYSLVSETNMGNMLVKVGSWHVNDFKFEKLEVALKPEGDDKFHVDYIMDGKGSNGEAAGKGHFSIMSKDGEKAKLKVSIVGNTLTLLSEGKGEDAGHSFSVILNVEGKKATASFTGDADMATAEFEKLD